VEGRLENEDRLVRKVQRDRLARVSSDLRDRLGQMETLPR
jgi:hypothetical protein